MNILAVGAHFDDVELGCSGTLAKHVESGDKVFVYVATNSEFSNHKNIKIRDKKVALKESEKALKIIGINKLFLGNFKTLEIEFNEALNKDLIKIIEKYKIDLIYTHWSDDVHHDHRAVARSSLHCGRHVKNLLCYRSNWYSSDKVFDANYFVDISNFWKIKKLAIKCHKSELTRVYNKWLNFWEHEAKNNGLRIGVKYAEAFQLIKSVK